MNDKAKSLGLGLGATSISMGTSLLPAVRACTGMCGSCGGACVGLIFGLAGGFIFFAGLKKQANQNQSKKEEKMSQKV